jgi:protein-tyrosine phosphatase
MQKIKLVDTNKYDRDKHSKAIVSNDLRGLAAYKAQKQKTQQLETFGEDINRLKQEFSDIKNILMQILDNQGREA